MTREYRHDSEVYARDKPWPIKHTFKSIRLIDPYLFFYVNYYFMALLLDFLRKTQKNITFSWKAKNYQYTPLVIDS